MTGSWWERPSADALPLELRTAETPLTRQTYSVSRKRGSPTRNCERSNHAGGTVTIRQREGSVSSRPGVDPRFSRAIAEVQRAAADGDFDRVRHAYQLLGEDLERSYGNDLSRVPVLSYRDTAGIVAHQVPEVCKRVLDAGCGPNPSLSMLLWRSERTVVALDIGLGTARLARAVARQGGVPLSVVVGDLERLPFRRGAFSCVVCDDTIEHVPDDRTAMTEIIRTLGPDGTAVIATPNRRSLQVVWRKARDRARGRRRPAAAYYAAASHLREYTHRDVERLVGTHGHLRRFVPNGWSAHGGKARIAGAFIARVAPRLSRTVIAVISSGSEPDRV